MKREEVIGIKLECIGIDIGYEPQFTVSKIYEVVDIGKSLPKIMAEDGFDWTVWANEYINIEDMIYKLNKSTSARFKLHVETKTKKENSKMRKSELEGKFVRCTSSRGVDYRAGDIIQIRNGEVNPLRGEDNLFSWYMDLPNQFTLQELNTMLKKYSSVTFEYIGDDPQSTKKVKADAIKPNKKSKLSEIKVPISVQVDMLFDKPIVEESKDDLYIFAGRTTIYFSKEFGEFGIATVNSDELKSYSKEIGMSLAFRRCYMKIDGGK